MTFKIVFFILGFLTCSVYSASSQEILPGITVRDFQGKMVISWQNQYKMPIANISIQRSFDSTKNYSTIGSVLNPQALENGYADTKPPYNKMYYRVFISFEGGSYLFSSIARPVKIARDSSQFNIDGTENNRYPWQANPMGDSGFPGPEGSTSLAITYPSQRIYTVRENNVVLHLPDAASKKYHAKFYDENEKLLFELTKLKEEYLIVEKVNFVHAGWFHFELFDNDELVEKNRFYIGKDNKNNNESLKRPGNK